jgi:adenine-specific DNA-methyltransferase
MDERGVYFPGDISGPNFGQYRYDVLHTTTGKVVKEPASGWRYPEATMLQRIDAGIVHFGNDESTIPNNKVYLRDNESQSLTSIKYRDGRVSSNALKALMGGSFFTNPKNVDLLAQFIHAVGVSGDDIVLDFFSGSGTTAQAVMQLNSTDGSSRRHIQVQLPEPTPEDSEARAAGFETIAQIARRRIELAGEKILADAADRLKDRPEPLDVGFRSYVLADTNFSKWQMSSEVDQGVLEQRLRGLGESAADEGTPDDLLTEILLKQGYSLTERISPAAVGGLDVRVVGDKLVLAYLTEHVKPTLDQLRSLVDDDPARIIVLEDAFHGDDELKTNLAQLCKSKGIELWTA